MTSCKVCHSTFKWSAGETARYSVPKIDHCSIAKTEIDFCSFGLLYGNGIGSLFGRGVGLLAILFNHKTACRAMFGRATSRATCPSV